MFLMKQVFVFIGLFIGFFGFSQEIPRNLKTKFISTKKDSIQIDSISILPSNLKLYNSYNQLIDFKYYQVDFVKSVLILKDSLINLEEEFRLQYQVLPNFLTRKYTANDKRIIVPQSSENATLYRYQPNDKIKNTKLFEGLYTSGSLSRGVTIGNNQDAVVNSNFNLQIEGKLSETVGIRANITDNEIPLQEGGYTQRIDEFDKVFIELFHKNWSVKAGDIDLINRDSYFMRFQKKISGIAIDANLNHQNGKSKIFASGALVKGRFSTFEFVGLDGNQGPYKILGPSNERYILIVSGSERIYANGVLLKRGENYDYTMDYNNGEITFTTIYPVTANLRFRVEYQISDTNYTRFITFDGADFQSDKLKMGVKYYYEKDAKNKPIQQDLTDEQKQILAAAGNDKSKMIAPSEVPAVYDENRILYKKITQNNTTYFEYTNSTNEELYQVNFTYVGQNNGDYNILTTLAAGRVYTYIPAVNGIKQGNYAPVKQLVAPESLQMFSVNADYKINAKSDVSGELTLSDKNQNLYSAIDNENNKGLASKLNWKQTWIDKSWQLESNVDYQFVDENFNTIERFRNVEFNRDWNINPLLNLAQNRQQYIKGNLGLSNGEFGNFNYFFEHLELGDFYKGNRHNFESLIATKTINLYAFGSILNNEDQLEKNNFYRWYSNFKQNFGKFWIGAKLNYENNEKSNSVTNELDIFSHKFTELEGFAGVGDSTKVFTELGYNFRTTDSVHLAEFQNVSKAHTYFLKSKLIENKNTNLGIFLNYRYVNNTFIEDEKSLNSRVVYRQYIWNKLLTFHTLYETQTGNLPQQEFSYVEVDPGKGFYEWIDFNQNGIQELDEFVIAKFPDEAKYVRVLLPNINFIKTNQNKFSQTVNFNAKNWQRHDDFRKLISHFSNQAYFLIDSKTKREGGKMLINPFDYNDQNLIGLDLNFKNSLFFNRGLQKFSTTYTYLNSRKRSIFVFGDQDVALQSHQLQFLHKMGSFWLLDVFGGMSKNNSESITYQNRNYKITSLNFQPKISYLYQKNARLEGFYKYKKKDNQVDDFESLRMHVFGLNFQYAKKQSFTILSNVNLYFNEFKGNTNSPVAYQMLEGLQPGTNFTWLLSLQKRLTSFLDLNLNYTGRKFENSKTIHTGTMQLRASF